MLDLIIRNASLIDGTGAPAYPGSIGVKDGRIAALGKVDERAGRTLDADGRVVCPGFIDVHTHYDAQVFWDGTLSPSCYHGVTTVFGGFCGFSIAPLVPPPRPICFTCWRESKACRCPASKPASRGTGRASRSTSAVWTARSA